MSTEVLYRLRHMNGTLLYVGITNNWPTRMKAHSADKPWWDQVANIELVRLEATRPQVEAIERAVIVTERPLYNVAHNATGRVVLGSRVKRDELSFDTPVTRASLFIPLRVMVPNLGPGYVREVFDHDGDCRVGVDVDNVGMRYYTLSTTPLLAQW